MKDQIKKGNTIKLDASMVLIPYPRSNYKKLFVSIRRIDVIDIDIDYVTPIYTQFSLKNSEQISDIATNKDRVGEYFKFSKN